MAKRQGRRQSTKSVEAVKRPGREIATRGIGRLLSTILHWLRGNAWVAALSAGSGALIGLALVNALFLQAGPHPAPWFMADAGNGHASVFPIIEQAELHTVPSPEAVTGDPTVFAVQQKLAALGLLTGAIDGLYGPQTAEAIRAFEIGAGIAADGALTPPIIDAIMASGSGSSRAN